MGALWKIFTHHKGAEWNINFAKGKTPERSQKGAQKESPKVGTQ